MMAARWKKDDGEKRSMKRELALNYCLKQREKRCFLALIIVTSRTSCANFTRLRRIFDFLHRGEIGNVVLEVITFFDD